MREDTELRIAVAGLGAIGGRVATDLLAGRIPGQTLVAASARDVDKARKTLGPAGQDVQLVEPEALADLADVVVECLPASAFERVAVPAVEAGRTLLVLSAGALLDRENLIARAGETGARIIVPSGAILGLDIVRAAAEGEISSASIVTRKPPASLAGAPLIDELGLDLDNLEEAALVYEGPVREAIAHFPANVNVAVAISLAGIGADRTTIEVWADPSVARNTHTVSLESDIARASMTIESIPSPDNPRTGLTTPLSTLAALRRLTATFVVGT